LRQHGYEDPQVLAGLIRAWRDLYKQIEPDVIVAELAPTALLAAKGMKIKTVALGSSYDTPPKAVPMPPLAIWQKIDANMVAKREEAVLGVVNSALALNGLKPVKTIADMIAAKAEFLTAFEELDHYPDRASIDTKPPKYLGHFFSLESGQEMHWDKKARKRILAHISADSLVFSQMLQAFADLPKQIDVIVSVPGLPEAARKSASKPNVRIISGPVKLSNLLKDCDLGVSHASPGISCAFAANGIAQLLLPTHIEQLAFAKALGRNRLGLGVAGKAEPAKLVGLMNDLLSNREYTEKAREFANKYKSFKPEKLAQQLADSVMGLAQKGT
jgi:UDP:flavonoid glycosyltransferase YjiC (YdhE family)